uniref:Uncharacterized protein n=1 Tax=Salarias fasciatus TaxID=181472 RepID=A0A672HV50_SALFA
MLYTLQDLPDQLLVSLLQKRLNQEDCWTQGWVLEGFPWTRLQALSLQQAGILPQHVVLLEAPDVVLQQRGDGRLLDSLTGDVYHRTFAWPADDVVAQRLEKGRGLSGDQVRQHRREVTGLSSAYQQVLLVVNGDQPPADVSQQVLSFVQTRRCSRTPRILLFGPPGSGKSHQAKLLSEKYRLVDVCCAQVLRAAAAEGSRPGQLIQTYLDQDQDRAVPDSVVLQVLEDRLSREDCSVRGWILHGFPRDLQQARMLQQRPLQPNRYSSSPTAQQVQQLPYSPTGTAAPPTAQQVQQLCWGTAGVLRWYCGGTVVVLWWYC